MLKKLVNECRFNLTLETKGPFIIRDGRYKKLSGYREGADNIPICYGNLYDDLSGNVDKAKTFSSNNCYIPGTSLRGVLRSYSEKLVKTIIEENEPICCDPFSDESCSKRMDNNPLKIPYANVCIICRLFGCTGIASRIQIQDSITICRGEAIIRDGIGIDRFSGGVASVYNEKTGKSSGANYKNIVLQNYKFQNEIIIHNFELWQLGLLAYVFRDLEQELIPIGFGKSKGFGRVKGTVNDVKLIYYCGNQTQLKGIAELCPNERDKYNLIPVETDPVPLGLPLPVSEWESYRYIYPIPDSSGMVNSLFWKACAKAWNNSIDKFQTISEPTKGDSENG